MVGLLIRQMESEVQRKANDCISIKYTANVGRFLNGSRTKIEANVEVRWTLIDGSISHEGQFLPGLHLVMISRRLIKAGE